MMCTTERRLGSLAATGVGGFNLHIYICAYMFVHTCNHVVVIVVDVCVLDLFTPLFTCQYSGQKLSVIQGVCQ